MLLAGVTRVTGL